MEFLSNVKRQQFGGGDFWVLEGGEQGGIPPNLGAWDPEIESQIGGLAGQKPFVKCEAAAVAAEKRKPI